MTGQGQVGKVVARAVLVLAATTVSYALLAHRSDEPFVLGYSLFYLICLLLYVATAGFTIALFRRFRSSAWYAIAAIAIFASTLAVAVEVLAQVYARLNPAYDVLYLQPDRVTGWKGVPNLQFTWAGPHWAAFEFSVPTVLNSAGFRDRERTVEKPPEVVRVALLGDSFVEALQVPLNKTAGQLLERSLNSTAGERPGRYPGYEVLNFGVSAYGLGQYLLAWQTYARAYKPEYVFAYVAGFHMQRTVSRGGMDTQGSHDLWTRPTFKLHSNELVLEPAGQFEEFIAAQQKLVRNELGGARMRKRKMRGLFLRILLDDLNTRITRLQRRLGAGSRAGELSAEDLAINMRILEELGASVHRTGAQLIVVDAVRYFRDEPELSTLMREFCDENGFGYVNVSDDLIRKEDAGVSTKRAYDGHFNEVGNEVFAAAMHRWMTSPSRHTTDTTPHSEKSLPSAGHDVARAHVRR